MKLRFFLSSPAAPPVDNGTTPPGRAAVKAGTQKTAVSFFGVEALIASGPVVFLSHLTGGARGGERKPQLPRWWVPEVVWVLPGKPLRAGGESATVPKPGVLAGRSRGVKSLHNARIM